MSETDKYCLRPKTNQSCVDIHTLVVGLAGRYLNWKVPEGVLSKEPDE
jgi:hypothetical protein